MAIAKLSLLLVAVIAQQYAVTAPNIRPFPRSYANNTAQNMCYPVSLQSSECVSESPSEPLYASLSPPIFRR